MNLKKMALLAEILGGLGIIISILYLAFEVSENSQNLTISHHLVLSDQLLAIRGRLLENDALADIIIRGRADLSDLQPTERFQFETYLNSEFDVWENVWLMASFGRLDRDYSIGWDRAMCRSALYPGVAEAWADGLFRLFGDEFVVVANDCFARHGLPTASIQE
jgi:hypothetical protein